jgi:hypothetical protein
VTTVTAHAWDEGRELTNCELHASTHFEEGVGQLPLIRMLRFYVSTLASTEEKRAKDSPHSVPTKHQHERYENYTIMNLLGRQIT